MKDYETALTMCLEAFNICSKSRFTTFSLYSLVLNNLATAYGELKQYTKAIEYSKLALDWSEKHLPLYHPKLASLCLYSDDYKQALYYSATAVTIAQKPLSDEHPRLILYKETFEHINLRNMGRNLGQQLARSIL
ncbi:unnamed protein product [Rotaria sp. Silwood1]|nr:unnamed protein product [Rotaria sp. Silwood1]CAF1431979.1 unnamed protein product [Rotaria sp. Silwood1]CAF1669462.1 unnamed protein product [Rotaria sp. Silwood1]CAF1669472.1 unnamed protein product [Rotaria sp. Silwood1]CAF3584285.1 unnamed protein product [Rotaria sp. Silwood1]